MIPTADQMKQWRDEAAEITDPYERRDFLASKLERLETGYGRGLFDIEQVTHYCGAPACVEGWARYFWGLPAHRALREFLWLSKTAASDIFVGINPITQRQFYTPQTAAKILREAPRPPLGGGEEKP